MKAQDFENLIVAVFYIRYCEKRKPLDSRFFTSLFNKVKKEVYKLEEALLVDDKDRIIKQVSDRISEQVKDDQCLSDSEFYTLLHEDADWHIVIDSLAEVIKSDGIVSRQEKEIILKLANRYGVNVEETKRKLKNKYTKPQKFSIFGASILGLLIVAFALGAMAVNAIEKKKMAAFNIGKYIEQNPKLIFKTIHFSKYVIHGKPSGVNSHCDELNIMHVNGTADLYVDMSHLRMDSAQTDYLQRKLYLIYDSPWDIPVSVDVNVPSNQATIIETINPEPISNEEAKSIAKIASIVAGGTGGYVGGNIGASLGDGLLSGLGRLIGGTVGAAIGTAGAGYAAYVCTENFFTGRKLAHNDLEDKENMYKVANYLIGLEIMGGNLLSDPENDSKIPQHYEAECIRQLKEIMKKFGWQDVEVKFNYKTKIK